MNKTVKLEQIEEPNQDKQGKEDLQQQKLACHMLLYSF